MKKNKSQKPIGRNFTISVKTSDAINEMAKLPFYRNNRSMLVESLIVTNPEFIKFIENKRIC